uniref:Uncharacterized protein n=1 Tax=Pipistrellus kuhlii TaxID=59472 RepID=A0A7J8A833_PIPKU|nr:hypothetical protein mPipKuh1_009009 [Pipistrellus kuhlii]
MQVPPVSTGGSWHVPFDRMYFTVSSYSTAKGTVAMAVDARYSAPPCLLTLFPVPTEHFPHHSTLTTHFSNSSSSFTSVRPDLYGTCAKDSRAINNADFRVYLGSSQICVTMGRLFTVFALVSWLKG